MNSTYKETYMIIEGNLKISFKVEVALRKIFSLHFFRNILYDKAISIYFSA